MIPVIQNNNKLFKSKLVVYYFQAQERAKIIRKKRFLIKEKHF